MNSQGIKLSELFDSYEEALRKYGLSFEGRLSTLKRARSIIRKHEDQGLQYLDKSIIAEHLSDIEERFYTGKISNDHFNHLRRSIQRFISFVDTGCVELPNLLKGAKIILTPEYQQITDGFLASGEYHPNTRNDMRWIAHKYFNWLADSGFFDLCAVGATEIQRFLLDCSKLLAPSSMHNVKLYLKKLYEYLYFEGLAKSPYESLLSFPVNRETKIYPALPMADVNKLLASINRQTKSGKRSYAVMILGAELGLRACDVVALKLGDIDWVRGEIKIVQAKTGKPLVLPLTERVGEALQDYILNVRAKTEFQQIFLRINRPYTPLMSANAPREIFFECCKAASMEINRSYHTLRRSLATAMVTNGVAVTDVVQVLGGDDIDSARKYISLDSKNLKSCSLPFLGINPKEGMENE